MYSSGGDHRWLGSGSKASFLMGPGSGYWPPKLLSLRDETPLLALPDSVELLPPKAD